MFENALFNFFYRDGTAVIETDVFPATASDHSSQYVRVTLVASLPVGYPDVSPTVELKNPRGLDDLVLKIIEKEMEAKIQSLVGESVIFELIEVSACLNFALFLILKKLPNASIFSSRKILSDLLIYLHLKHFYYFF